MRTEATVLLHPTARAARPRGLARRSAGFWTELVCALVLVAGGTAATIAALVLVVVCAPLAAAIAAWLLWRSNARGRRTPPGARLHARRRARALGLVVLAGSARPAALRAVAGARRAG